MAQTKKSTAGGRNSSSGKRSASGRSYQKKNSGGRRNTRNTEPMDTAIRDEIFLIVMLAVSVFLFLCNFGVIGVAGNVVSGILFGIFGTTAYVMPLVMFVMIAFGMVNSGSLIAARKLVAGAVLFLIAGVIFELFTGKPSAAESYELGEIYKSCSTQKNGGGIVAGSVAYLLCHFLGMIGTVLTILVAGIVSLVVLTEKSFVSGVKSRGRMVYERTREDAEYRRERARIRRQEQEEERRLLEEQEQLRRQELENEKILRMDKKVSGVMIDTDLSRQEERRAKGRDDIHEINLEEPGYSGKTQPEEEPASAPGADIPQPEEEFDFNKIRINSVYGSDTDTSSDAMSEITGVFDEEEEPQEAQEEPAAFDEIPEPEEDLQARAAGREEKADREPLGDKPKAKLPDSDALHMEMKSNVPKKYMFPPISKLMKGEKKSGDSTKELRETAQKLQQTLQTFGVKVKITDISQGPAVTRYELQPEQGVKVSKIVGLTDDIKLNLAATDIRMEAPIPGKAAIGIEVPNKENSAVALRDILETREFKEFSSNLAFAVGKDIAGKTVVTDIAKMPHVLIAGATGSGKSVCINTLIMSILYKARPDEVRLIMIDPKVVELSTYNGIPHLLIPVVTDPKKAAGALNWAVTEMMGRYNRFAEINVRNIEGYNSKIDSIAEIEDDHKPEKMPQIVIIVDELADLMMVSPGEVEDAICRLAQLARAAGIHLIIATQRPSVNVITGLIKANMPSRIAFAVSSGVDSRTILDMNGAEKLLGKGDMLFSPYGLPKPLRVQGAFVSDAEVSAVVEFLSSQCGGTDPGLEQRMNEQMKQVEAAVESASSPEAGGGSDRDVLFEEAARFLIEKDKASIGMLQRWFKIGFNRAARIMDQLADAGVVGEEEGTKPRKILMSMEELEQYIEECL